MIHIKIYEDYYDDEPIKDYKKYMVFKYPHVIVVCEIVSVNTKKITIKRLYFYDGVEHWAADGQVFDDWHELADKRIIYQSDNLQDCLNNLSIVSQQQKFNL